MGGCFAPRKGSPREGAASSVSWGDSQPSHHADDSDGDAWPDLPAGSAAGLSEGTDVKQVI